MDIRARMKWCLAMWVRNRVAGSWFRMVVGVIVLYPYHTGMDTIGWRNITSAGSFPSGDLGFLDEPAAISHHSAVGL